MNIVLSLLLAALTWYPAPDWKDEPDRVASPHAKKGGTIRFNGAQAPKSLNGYVDTNTYTMMTFALMYENLLTTDTDQRRARLGEKSSVSTSVARSVSYMSANVMLV